LADLATFLTPSLAEWVAAVVADGEDPAEAPICEWARALAF
jgi:hypothetical protein